MIPKTRLHLLMFGLVVVAPFLVLQLLDDSHQLMRLNPPASVWVGLWGAMLVYLCSHAFRFLRFAMLMRGQRLRELLKVYAVATGASFAIPFKLGELFRIFWIGTQAGNLGRGVIVVWVERILDASSIALIYLAVAVRSDKVEISSVSGALILIPLMIILSVLVLRVLPDNMKNINLWMLRSYRGAGALWRLRWLERISRFTSQANSALADRTMSLLMLTVCIWGLEIYAVLLSIQSVQAAGNGLVLFAEKMASIIQPGRTLSALPGSELVTGLTLMQGVVVSLLAMSAWIIVVVQLARNHFSKERS